MQSCKQKNIDFSISKASDELMRVVELAHLDKLFTIDEQTGPADLVDVDVFSDTGANDKKIVENIYQNDDDLIAQELADLGSEDTASIGAAKLELSQDPIQENTESDAATGTENAENKGLARYVLDRSV